MMNSQLIMLSIYQNRGTSDLALKWFGATKSRDLIDCWTESQHAHEDTMSSEPLIKI